jgi:hypothetical protein
MCTSSGKQVNGKRVSDEKAKQRYITPSKKQATPNNAKQDKQRQQR